MLIRLLLPVYCWSSQVIGFRLVAFLFDTNKFPDIKEVTRRNLLRLGINWRGSDFGYYIDLWDETTSLYSFHSAFPGIDFMCQKLDISISHCTRVAVLCVRDGLLQGAGGKLRLTVESVKRHTYFVSASTYTVLRGEIIRYYDYWRPRYARSQIAAHGWWVKGQQANNGRSSDGAD